MAAGVFQEVESDPGALDDLLAEVVERVAAPGPPPERPTGRSLESLALMEAVTRWEDTKHPRWPKGSKDPVTGESIAGRFMEVGQQFVKDGKRFEIAFFGPKGSGRVYANRAGGPQDVGLVSFNTATAGGGEKGEHPTIAGVEPAEAKSFNAGKGTGGVLTGLTVDPFVDPESHDPSLQLPKLPGVTMSLQDWAAFGRADQENFIRLAEEFGHYSPSENAAMIKKIASQMESQAVSDVRDAYSGQHGSSTGTRFNFAGFVHGVTDKLKLTSAQKRREKARRAMQEMAAVVQWDLYNRTRSPDVTVFHRDDNGHPPSWWQQHFIHGNDPVMSGMSQSWKYGVWSGDTVVVMPLAIRNIVMSTYSVHISKELGGTSSYAGEREVSTPDQLQLDDRALVFSENKQLTGSGVKKWLADVTSKPAGGRVARQLRDFIVSGKIPPLPPAAPEVQMYGQNHKLWADPPADIGVEVLTDFSGKPFAAPKKVSELDYLEKDASGQPISKPANALDLKAGDIIEGQQGSRYVILDDPGNLEGFPYVRAEIGPGGNWLGPSKTYSFSGAGSKPFKKLNGKLAVPKPKLEEQQGPLWDPDAYANGTEAVFTKDLPKGAIFKVNEIPYQVEMDYPGTGGVHIQDLNTGKHGEINIDYKATPLVLKEGYVAIDTSHDVKPEVGVTFAYQGDKFVITKYVKGTGQWQAKRAKGSGVIKLNPDDPVLAPENLHAPDAWTFGDTVPIGTLQPGEKFHGGMGAGTQKPYVVVSHSGNKTLVRNLDTGKESELASKKKYKRLVPVAPELHGSAPSTPDQHIPSNWEPAGDAAALKDFGAGVGDKFQWVEDGKLAPLQVEVAGVPGEWPGKGYGVRVLTGPQAGEIHDVDPGQAVTLLVPAKGATGPVSGFDRASYLDGPTKKMADLKEGDLFLSSKGVPYVVKKTGPKSGAVAMNLYTGKPWPAIKYEKEFATLVPAGKSKPYSKLKQGDPVKLGFLDVGDQFKTDTGEIFQIVQQGDPSNDEDGPLFTEVTPFGAVGQYKGVSPDLLVTFHAKNGEGYDPVKNPPDVPLIGDEATPEETDPNVLPNAEEAHFMSFVNDPDGVAVSDLGKGTPFVDAAGIGWFVKQAGAQPIISDGEKLYVVDGNAQVKWGPSLTEQTQNDLAHMMAIDASPEPGMSAAGGNAELAQAQQYMADNVGNVPLHQLKVGDWFQISEGGPPQKVTAIVDSGQPDNPDAWMVSAAAAGESFSQGYWGSTVPTKVAKLSDGEPSKVFIPNQLVLTEEGHLWRITKVYGDGFFTLTSDGPNPEGLNVALSQIKPYLGGGDVQTVNGMVPIDSLQVNTEFTVHPSDVLPYTAPGGEKLMYHGLVGDDHIGIDSGGGEWVLPKYTLVQPAGALEDAQKVDFDPNDYSVGLSLVGVTQIKKGGRFYWNQAPYELRGPGPEGANYVEAVNLDSGQKVVIGQGEKVVPLTPKGGSSPALPDYQVGDKVEFLSHMKKEGGPIWTVTGLSANGAIVKLLDANGVETAVGKGLVKFASAEEPLHVGDPVKPSQLKPGMTFKAAHSGAIFLVNSVTPQDNSDEYLLNLKRVGSDEPANDISWSDTQYDNYALNWVVDSLPNKEAPPPPSPEPETKADVENYHGGTKTIAAELDVGDVFSLPYGKTLWTVEGFSGANNVLVVGQDSVTGAAVHTEIDPYVLNKVGTVYLVDSPTKKLPDEPQGLILDGTKVKIGDQVQVWPEAWNAPKVVTLTAIHSNGTVEYDDGKSAPGKATAFAFQSWLKPIQPPIEKKEFELGGKATWHANGTTYHGYVASWDPATSTLTVVPEGGVGGLSMDEKQQISDSQMIEYIAPDEETKKFLAAAGKPNIGDYVLGSDVKKGQFIEVQTKATSSGGKPVYEVVSKGYTGSNQYKLGLKVVANPYGSHKVGDVIEWEGNDGVVQAGANPGEPSPWKLTVSPTVAAQPKSASAKFVDPQPAQSTFKAKSAKTAGVEEMLASVKAKYGVAPPDVQIEGFKSDWGSGGAYKHRRLADLPTGQKFMRKNSSATWVLLGAGPYGGVIAMRMDTGDARLIMNVDAKVKPPAGKTWKAGFDS